MKLRTKLFLAWVMLALLLWAGAFWVVRDTVHSSYDQRARDSFVRTRYALEATQKEHSDRLQQAGSLLIQIPELRALIAEHSYEFQAELASSLRERLDFLTEVVDAQFITALNANGELIAAGGRLPWENTEQLSAYLHDEEPARRMLEQTFRPSLHLGAPVTRRGTGGLWAHNQRLYQVVAVPLMFQQGAAGEPMPIEGALIIGTPVTDQLAHDLGQSQDCQVSFIAGDAIAASSVTDGSRQGLVATLRAVGDRGAEPFIIEWAGIPHLTFQSDVVDPISGTTVGQMVIQRSLRDANLFLTRLSHKLMVTMGLGLVVAAIGSFALSTAITRPIQHLLGAVHRVASGDLHPSIVPQHRRDELGQLAHAFKDMVHQLRVRQGLERRVVEMETASRTKSEFLANMSHEIRTPMTAILGHTELLRDPHQSSDARAECVEVIHRNGNHLLSIINDILDLSKIEANELEIERVPSSVAEVLGDVASLMRIRAIEKGLAFEVNLDGPVPQTIQTDPTRLRQVLINLVGNAIKFTDSGHVRIVVSMASQDAQEPSSDPPKLQFQVIDSGVGISAEQLEHIFEPFSQADSSTARRFGGSGLGLSICRRLTGMLGGELTVQSTPHVGSAFTVQVSTGPLENVPMIERFEEALRDAPGAAPDEAHPNLTGHILLAEDGADNRNLLAHYLRAAGAEVTAVEDGQAACDAVRTADPPFDLVLMDMQMPVMDGYTATCHLRSAGYTVPIVALTANAMADDDAKCRQAGCSDYLSKPIARRLLIETAARHMEVVAASSPRSEAPALELTSPTLEAPSAGREARHGTPIDIDAMDESIQPIRDAYIASLPGQVSRLLDLLKHEHLDALAGQLHTLKGTGGQFGLMAITDQAEAAEATIQDRQGIDAIAREVSELAQLIRRVDGYDEAHETIGEPS